MSRAFVKETDNAAPPPERMVSDGPNLVTPAGFAQIAAHVSRIEAALKDSPDVLARETLERDLRYWQVRKASAKIVQPPSGDTVAFGSRVTIARNGREQKFQIVGEDEADPANARLNVRSPLAAAILGAREGETVDMENPPSEIVILRIEN